MKLHLTSASAQNLFTAYSESSVTVNSTCYQTSLFMLPDQPVENWPPENLESLTEAHFAPIIQHSPEVILLGTGTTLHFPSRALRQAFVRMQIGVEVMDTPAACRTYNILAGEGRQVAVALILTPILRD